MTTRIGPAADLTAGTVKYAVGNNGDYFAVTRKCRHLGADLDQGTINADGCLVCPWHGAAYDVTTGRMVRGPQGIFAKIPGLSAAFKALTFIVPLGRAKVVTRDSDIFIE